MTAADPAPVVTIEARHVTTLEHVEKWAAAARKLGLGDSSPVALSSIDATIAATTYLSRIRP